MSVDLDFNNDQFKKSLMSSHFPVNPQPIYYTMCVDLDFDFKSKQFEENLMKDMNLEMTVKDLEMEPYPSLLVLSQLASAVYSDGGENRDLPSGWKMLTVYFNKGWTNGYFGAAYCNHSLQQVVIAHRGTAVTNLGALWTDLNGVFATNYTSQMNSAITFSDRIMKVLHEVGKNHGLHLQVSVTGHSLGGWLAQITAFTLKYIEVRGNRFIKVHDRPNDRHVHVVTFDSPGCGDMLKKIISHGYYRYGQTMFSDDLDITNYLAPPNRINTAGSHVGTIHVVHLAVSHFSKMNKIFYTFAIHPIKNFVKAFKDKREIREVLDWPVSSGPLGGKEYAGFHARASHGKDYIPEPEEEEQQQDTWEIELRYKTKEIDNSCNLRVFSEEELYVLNLWSELKLEKLKMDLVDDFINEHNLGDLFTEFKIDSKSSTITCQSKPELQTVVRHIKLLMRWFCAEFTEAVELQSKQIPRVGALKYQMATQIYLNTLPECVLHFKDTFGLEAFLESNKDRILQIITEDSLFEVARLHDLLSQMRESRELQHLDGYLSKEKQSFMDVKQIESLERTIDVDSLYNPEFHPESLVVVDCATPGGVSRDCRQFFKRNIKYINKKLICVLSPQSDYQKFLASFNTPVLSAPYRSIGLTDLTEVSQKELFERKMLIVEEEHLSWADYAGTQNLTIFLSFMNSFIDNQLLKSIVTDRQYTIEVKNPHLNKLLVHSSIVSTELSVSKVAQVVQEHSPRVLLVINGINREDLWTEKWKELLHVMGQDAEKSIFTTTEDGDETFKLVCRKNPSATIFCLVVSDGCIYYRDLYRKQFYMERKFHEQIVFNLQEFALKTDVEGALFVVQNEMDKQSLVHLLPEWTRDAFFIKDNIKTAASAEEADTIKIENTYKSVHILQREASSGQFLWQRSRGSLAGLRPFVTPGTGSPKSESDLCETNHKVVIIADEPGMGKSTSLASMSRLLNSNWVIWIDLKNFKIPSKNLPAEPRERCQSLLRENLTHDRWLDGLLQFCLDNKHSRQVYIMFDGFDEIKKEYSAEIDTKNEVLTFLQYLCDKTTARIWITTRFYEGELLENTLSTFAVMFQKIDEQQQREYLVDFWRSHLLLELKGCKNLMQSKFEECAQSLYAKAKEDLGEGVKSFMGVPLQMRMLADVFLQHVGDYIKSKTDIGNAFEVESVFSLYEKFIKVKYDIYFKSKTGLNAGMSSELYEMTIHNFTTTHRMLGLRTLFPQFAEKNYKDFKNKLGAELSRIGLVQSGGEGSNSVEFIHRTLAEYFCADQTVHWLSETTCNLDCWLPTVELLLTEIFLQDSHKIIRMFINNFLLLHLISDNAREFVALEIVNLWKTKQHLFFDRHHQTALHLAVVENNFGIVDFLIGGLKSKPGLINFVAAYQHEGFTALCLASRKAEQSSDHMNNAYINIINQFVQSVSTCPYEIQLELLLATCIISPPSIFTTYLEGDSVCRETRRAFIRTQKIISNDVPPFLAAVEECRGKDVEELCDKMENDIERNYLLRAPRLNGDNALHIAAQNEEIDDRKKIMKIICNRNIPGIERSYNLRGDTPVHLAAELGYLDVIKHFENNGVRINCLNLNNQTALHKASEKGHLSVMKFLIEKKVDINSADRHGLTALHKAAYSGKIADYSFMTDYKDIMALHKVPPKDYVTVVEFLIEKGAVINSTDKNGITPLHNAAYAGNLPVLEILMKAGADINSTSQTGITALQLAANARNLPMVMFLVKNGVNINSANEYGFTALHNAAELGCGKIVKFLVENRAGVNSTTYDGHTALHKAAFGGQLSVVKCMVHMGVNVNSNLDKSGRTPLHLAIEMGRVEVVEFLIKNGADVNCVDKYGLTALHKAAFAGDLSVMKKLLKTEARKDIHSRDNQGLAPLHKAYLHGQLMIADMLIANGADINCVDHVGQNALHKAANDGNLKVFVYLIKKGAKYNSVDKLGRTAFHIAVERNRLPIVKFLVSKGMDK